MKRWQKWTTAVVVVAAVAGGTKAAGWWGSNPSSDKNTLNYAMPTDIQTLDISKATDQYSNLVLGNTESNLLRVNAKGEPAPDLAKSYQVSDDGLTYTVELRSGLKWSDGSKLTAQDVVYSWQRMVNPKTASQYASLASGVLNADDIMAGKKDVSELGVSASGNTITFKLDHAMPQFKYLLAFANFAPQKQAYVSKEGDKYGTTSEKQIYSGAYKFEGWNGTNGKFKMVKNDNYWDAKNVKTKTVNWQVVKNADTALKLYKQGKIDRVSISNSPEMYSANKNNKDVKSTAVAAATYLEYNQANNAFLKNEKIRQALNLATNRTELASQATGGSRDAAQSLVSKGLTKTTTGEDLSAYVKPGYTYDKKKAQELFKQGLAEVNQGKMKVTIETDADAVISKNTVDYIKQAWESTFGSDIEVTEKIVPFKQRLKDSQAGDFDIVVTNWNGDYQDGSTFYDLFASKDAGYNQGRFTNDAYFAAVKKAETTDATNASARQDDFKDAEKALMEEANINPLYSWKASSLVRSNVKGVVESPVGLTLDLTYAHRK
ncbi:peptide ABC transporter substrate-binding protein [Fructobacillus sp. M1-13]|uniref:Peptide ABC transporter substrate-binding protein n=1 Tax=Fructobacillus papyriferae TaxID=2713171 RepID=A0ABS5QQQ5_9LACO|nr:peptide ABC transporter substrate-binding protein [Fructobacillus papyriferae]MBS9335496.1 peptide ABC transporter substrate-binding protein [Fructobacillus papyriferae]MCD2159266.1 peptide ABC transporter substrate-binding protein [Fructobacillus papyriferae]